jgi:predicted small metal-binding protein
LPGLGERLAFVCIDLGFDLRDLGLQRRLGLSCVLARRAKNTSETARAITDHVESPHQKIFIVSTAENISGMP